MTELQLYKFISEHDIEYSHQGKEILVWLPFYQIERFVTLANSTSLFDEGGLNVLFQQSCIALDILPICQYFGIDPDNVFDKK